MNVREKIKEVGFDNEKTDIDYKTCKVLLNISKQSPDIAMGVDKSLEQKEGSKQESEGAGDQGLYQKSKAQRLYELPYDRVHTDQYGGPESGYGGGDSDPDRCHGFLGQPGA